MGLIKLLVIATALCAAVMAYLMYTPIPTGYTDQLYIRYHMGATQLATTLVCNGFVFTLRSGHIGSACRVFILNKLCFRMYFAKQLSNKRVKRYRAC